MTIINEISKDKNIWYEANLDCFNLYWDNDVVSLNKEEVGRLILILCDYLDGSLDGLPTD